MEHVRSVSGLAKGSGDTAIALLNAQGKPTVSYLDDSSVDPLLWTENGLSFGVNNENFLTTEKGTRASWTVDAVPDGTLTDASGRTYPSLFWDGPVSLTSPEQGFVVAREDAVTFLEEKLGQLGLSDKEAADFITYWAPRIRANEYTFVSFDASSYAQQVTYSFADEAGNQVVPDTFIRVFMTMRKADASTVVTPQNFAPTPTRSCFTVVEWGGTEQ